MNTRSQVLSRIGLLGALAVAALLAIPTTLAAQSPETVLECPPMDGLVISPDLEHGVYRGAGIVTRRVKLVQLRDARGGHPCGAGFTVQGSLKQTRVPLAFDRPVATYVRATLEQLLGAPGEAPPGAIPVSVEIEQFDVDYKRTWMGAGDATFEARLAVNVLTDQGPVHAGWVHARETCPQAFSLTGAQKAAVYPGLVALARGFADPSLPLERLAAAPPLAAAEDAAPAAEPVAEAPRRTITTEYQTPLALQTRSFPTWRAIYLNVTESETRDAFGDFFGIAAGGMTWWLTARSGIEGEIGFISSKGSARVLDPSWNVQTGTLEMWALPMSVNYLYRLGGHGGSPNFAPYIGTGIGLVPGLERMRLNATQGDVEFAANLGAFRGAFEGHGILGADFHLSESFHGIIESRWTHSGDGSTVEAVDEKKAEDVAASALLHSIIRRSNFNFTGWGIQAGFRWDLR